jgi:signal transduction histidine kinase
MPLTGIVTQAQVLQRRAERDPSAPVDRVGLMRLVDQSLRLKRLVVDLLDVSRLDQGSLIGEREEVDLSELVRDLVSNEGPRWGRVNIACDEPVIVAVDPPRFEQVVNNLIENALKYSPQQSDVFVKLWCEKGEARLSVRDEGIGIPIDDQPLVFERFHRARNVDDRRFAGMGLGLYIARGIVEQHGGRIWVDSAPGAGSTFSVALPPTSPNIVPEEPAPESTVR